MSPIDLLSSATSLTKEEEEYDKKTYQAEAVKKKIEIPLVLDFLKDDEVGGKSKARLSIAIIGEKR